MDDLTGQTPVRRMSVARGRLAPVPDDASADVGACEAAAKLAIKRADGILPDLHPFHATHIDVAMAPADGGLEATVTVQGHARRHVDGYALLGVAVALLAARDQLGTPDAALQDVRLVQNVV